MPAISIGMSAWNASPTLARCIASVLKQSFKDWELIIIDDGSTDKTADLVRQIKDPRIRLVVHTKNHGPAARLNEAVHLSAGDYHARMDADDIMYPDRLELQYEFLQRHPDVDLVGGAMMVFRGGGTPMGMRGEERTHEQLCGHPWSGIPIAHPTWMGRIAWFLEHPYPEEMIRAQDQALLLSAFAHSRFATLGEILVGYREERLRVRRLLRGRYYAVRAHWRYSNGASQRALAVAKQALVALVEACAATCGLEYSVLRHRARPITAEQAARWKQVWAGVSRAPVFPSDPAGAARNDKVRRE